MLRAWKALAVIAAICAVSYSCGKFGSYSVVASMGFFAPGWLMMFVGYFSFLMTAAFLLLAVPACVAWTALRWTSPSIRSLGAAAATVAAFLMAVFAWQAAFINENQRTAVAISELTSGDVNGPLPDPSAFHDISLVGPNPSVVREISLVGECDDLCTALLWSGQMDTVTAGRISDRQGSDPPTPQEFIGFSYKDRLGR